MMRQTASLNASIYSYTSLFVKKGSADWLGEERQGTWESSLSLSLSLCNPQSIKFNQNLSLSQHPTYTNLIGFFSKATSLYKFLCSLQSINPTVRIPMKAVPVHYSFASKLSPCQNNSDAFTFTVNSCTLGYMYCFHVCPSCAVFLMWWDKYLFLVSYKNIDNLVHLWERSTMLCKDRCRYEREKMYVY